MSGGTRFLFGRSLFGNCGDYVIVAEDEVERLEKGAREARQIVARASNAKTFGVMERILNELPTPFWVDLGQCTTEEVMGPDVRESGPEDVPMTPDLWATCLDVIFQDGASGGRLPYVMVDTTACYQSVGQYECVQPFIRMATHDLDAGFNDVDGAVRALEAEGHTCIRDDQRLRRVFGFEVSDVFLIP